LLARGGGGEKTAREHFRPARGRCENRTLKWGWVYLRKSRPDGDQDKISSNRLKRPVKVEEVTRVKSFIEQSRKKKGDLEGNRVSKSSKKGKDDFARNWVLRKIRDQIGGGERGGFGREGRGGDKRKSELRRGGKFMRGRNRGERRVEKKEKKGGNLKPNLSTSTKKGDGSHG